MAGGGGGGGAGGAGGVGKPAKPSKGLPTGLGAPVPQGSLGGSGGSGATVSPNGPSPLGVAAASGVSDTGSGLDVNSGASATPAVANSVYNSGYTGAYGSFPPDGSYAGSPAGGVSPGDYGSAFAPNNPGRPADTGFKSIGGGQTMATNKNLPLPAGWGADNPIQNYIDASGRPVAPARAVNPNAAWKDPIIQTFLQARDAASTPGVGITNIPMLDAARQAKQQAIQAYKVAQRPPPGFQGDPNSLIPRGTTSGGVTQYYNPATGGMYVGNPFRTFDQGMTGLLGAAPGPARGW